MWIWIWLGVVVITMILEFISTDMIAIWFSVGGLVSLILAALSVPVWVQLVVFVVISAVLLLSFRKLALKFLLGKDKTKTNADALISQQIRLINEINEDKYGTVKINGVIWNATTENNTQVIPANTLVEIIKISGNKVIVKPIEEIKPEQEEIKTNKTKKSTNKEGK